MEENQDSHTPHRAPTGFGGRQRRRRRRRVMPENSIDNIAANQLEFDASLGSTTKTNKTITIKGVSTPATTNIKSVSSNRKTKKLPAASQPPMVHVESSSPNELPPIPHQKKLSSCSTTPVGATSKRDTTSSTSEMTPTASVPQKTNITHNKNALCVDTRTLDTTEGRSIGQSFLVETNSFLESVDCRGMPPLVVTHVQSESSARRPCMKIVACTHGASRELQSMLIRPSLHIRPTSAAATDSESQIAAIQVPTRLLANASWKLFGDLIQETVASQCKMGLVVTLLTNSIAFASDSSIPHHTDALTKFWNRIRPYFHKNQLACITLVVLDTETLYIVDGDKGTAMPKDNVLAGNNEDVIMEDFERLLDSDNNHDAQNKEMKPQSVTDVLVEGLQLHIQALANADYKVDRSREHAITPVDMQLKTHKMSSSNLITTVGHQWLDRLVHPTDGSLNVASIKNCITLELPETVDGTQCNISLQMRYRLMPYSHAEMVTRLREDLNRLATCQLEVVQCVPVSCIDPNLIFGVPLEVLPAWEPHQNEEQFHESKMLVHVLLQELRQQDDALLLRLKKPIKKGTRGTHRNPLFHSDCAFFLLLAEDVPPNGRTVVPIRGTLFRYATAEQMLSRGEENDVFYKYDSDDNMLSQLTDYVQSSLDMLPKSFVNPLVLHQEEVLVERKIKQMKFSSPGSREIGARQADDTRMLLYDADTEKFPAVAKNVSVVVDIDGCKDDHDEEMMNIEDTNEYDGEDQLSDGDSKDDAIIPTQLSSSGEYKPPALDSHLEVDAVTDVNASIESNDSQQKQVSMMESLVPIRNNGPMTHLNDNSDCLKAKNVEDRIVCDTKMGATSSIDGGKGDLTTAFKWDDDSSLDEPPSKEVSKFFQHARANKKAESQSTGLIRSDSSDDEAACKGRPGTRLVKKMKRIIMKDDTSRDSLDDSVERKSAISEKPAQSKLEADGGTDTDSDPEFGSEVE